MQTPYDRVMAVLRGRKEEADRLPCINTVSTATKEFMQAMNAWWPAAHKDPEKMAELGSAAHKLCGLDNITVPFDMTVEAEVLGAPVDLREAAIAKGKLLWPGVKKFIIKEPQQLRVENAREMCRVPTVVKAIKILKEELGGKVPINVFMDPPFTCLSSYVVDTITFMMMLNTQKDKVHEFMRIAMGAFINIAKAYEEAGADVITLHEMGAPMDNISPTHFEEFVMPYLKRLIGSIECITVLNICGSTLGIIDKMINCGPSAIAIDERTPMDGARRIADSVRLCYPLIGNISSRETIHEGSTEAIQKSVEKVIKQGVDAVAPGCDFWIGTPTEHIKVFVNAVEKYGKICRYD